MGYSICFDNVNTKVTVRHQMKDKKNKMYNMVQAYAARDRIPTLHLSDIPPPPYDIYELPLTIYFPSELDEVKLRSEMTVLTERVLCRSMMTFQELQPHINQHIEHRYSKESSKKSDMVCLTSKYNLNLMNQIS